MLQKTSKNKALALCALFTALTAVCAQLQIPLPMVPISLALFAVHLTGSILGPKYGAMSMICYALLAAIGVPVLAGFGGGPAALFGKTGGYVLGYILDAAVVGLAAEKWGTDFFKSCTAMAIGTAVCYAFGTLWFMFLASTGLRAALTLCVLPFLPGDVVKIALAAPLSLALRTRLGHGFF